MLPKALNATTCELALDSHNLDDVLCFQPLIVVKKRMILAVDFNVRKYRSHWQLMRTRQLAYLLRNVSEGCASSWPCGIDLSCCTVLFALHHWSVPFKKHGKIIIYNRYGARRPHITRIGILIFESIAPFFAPHAGLKSSVDALTCPPPRDPYLNSHSHRKNAPPRRKQGVRLVASVRARDTAKHHSTAGALRLSASTLWSLCSIEQDLYTTNIHRKHTPKFRFPSTRSAASTRRQLPLEGVGYRRFTAIIDFTRFFSYTGVPP